MKINWSIASIAAVWWWIETDYFGWNAKPASVEELFADGLALALFALAFLRVSEVKVVINRTRIEP